MGDTPRVLCLPEGPSLLAKHRPGPHTGVDTQICTHTALASAVSSQIWPFINSFTQQTCIEASYVLGH